MFGWLKRKKNVKNEENLDIFEDLDEKTLDKELRIKKKKIKDLDFDIEIARREYILREKYNYYSDDELDEPDQPTDSLNNPDALVMNLLNKVLAGKVANVTQPSPAPTILDENPQSAGETDLSEQDIRTFFHTNLTAPQRVYAKNMPDDELKKIIKSKIPNISEKTLDLCCKVAKE